MTRYIIVVLVGVLFAGVACSDATKARLDVAKDNTLRKIDEMLGTLNVKRKEVALSLQSLKDAVAGMGKAKIKSQVKLEQLDQKAQGLNDQTARADATLKKVRGYLAANEAVEINGKTYTPEALSRMATQVLDTRKGYASQIAGWKTRWPTCWRAQGRNSPARAANGTPLIQRNRSTRQRPLFP